MVRKYTEDERRQIVLIGRHSIGGDNIESNHSSDEESNIITPTCVFNFCHLSPLFIVVERMALYKVTS